MLLFSLNRIHYTGISIWKKAYSITTEMVQNYFSSVT